jgi:hypothetical protein
MPSLWFFPASHEGEPDFVELILAESAGTVLRWLHVIAGIAWIGSSFYFIHLDLSPEAAPRAARRRQGRRVAGPRRRFLPHDEKYLVAPAQMPDSLTWFTWEATGRSVAPWWDAPLNRLPSHTWRCRVLRRRSRIRECAQIISGGLKTKSPSQTGRG